VIAYLIVSTRWTECISACVLINALFGLKSAQKRHFLHSLVKPVPKILF
jgi:hypothetical protein